MNRNYSVSISVIRLFTRISILSLFTLLTGCNHYDHEGSARIQDNGKIEITVGKIGEEPQVFECNLVNRINRTANKMCRFAEEQTDECGSTPGSGATFRFHRESVEKKEEIERGVDYEFDCFSSGPNY